MTKGAAASAPSRMSIFLRSVFFDFLLTLLVSTCLVYTVSFAFESAPALRSNLLLEAVLCALLLAVLYAGSWSKRMAGISGFAYVVVAIILVFAFSALSPQGTELFADGGVNDVPENLAIFALVLVVIPPVVFLLSRRTLGVAVLLLAGVFTCEFVPYLYRDFLNQSMGTPVILAAYVGIGALFVMQGYRQGLLAAQRVKKTAFGTAFAYGLGIGAVCVGVGVLLFFLIISNLGLQTLDVKPFQDNFSRPTVYYTGVYEEQNIENADIKTSNLNSEHENTNDNSEAAGADASANGVGEGPAQAALNTVVNMLNLDNWQEQFDAISFQTPLSLKILLPLLIIAVIALAIWLRLRVRERRLQKWEQEPMTNRVLLMYGYLCDRLAKIGFGKEPSATPLEYAFSSVRQLSPFAENASNTSFSDITLLYQRASFGMGNVSEEEYARMVDFYRAFFAHARVQKGTFKWAFWYFWRI